MTGLAEPVPPAAAIAAPSAAWWTAALTAAGAGLAFLGLAYDLLVPGATPGFGRIQAGMALAGGLLLGVGRLRADTRPWRKALREVAVPFAGFALVAVQVGLLTVAAALLHLESPALYRRILPLVFAGFIVHHLLPAAWRLAGFVVLSWVGAWLVFGLVGAAWLVGVGLALIAICHLPLGFAHRVGLLLAAAAGLALMRGGLFPAPWPGAIWPILGSMFMFRLIIYMYDLRHATERPPVVPSLAYFFLLPNLAFPLFPVVDWATFRRTYRDRPDLEIYQRGVHWMLIGLTHLIGYRVVYQFLTIGPGEVADAAGLARYMVTTFLLYLKVSGQFHFIVGMLHLFGFRLPETHRFFFLASSFTDFWRRINIYWKEFMTKVFYFPAYFRLRKRGDTLALVASTLVVFFATWFLHSYQWFWLLGTALLTWPDTLFWLALAVLLVASALVEQRRGRSRSLGARRHTLRQSAHLAVGIIATFTTICVLWSLWSSPTVGEWLALLGRARLGWPDLAMAAGVAGVVAGLLVAGDQLRGWGGARAVRPAAARPPHFMRSFALHLGWLLLLVGISNPATSAAAPAGIQQVLRDIRVDKLNARDALTQHRGYYENLTGVNQFNSPLWTSYAQRPDEWREIWQSDAVEMTGDFYKWLLRPLHAMVLNGTTFRTNRWGMRDQDYEQERPPETLRVALLGQSYVVGQGVNDHETFEALLEARLNAESLFVQQGYRRVEILNMAVPALSPLRQVMLLRERVPTFQPQVAVLVAHAGDTGFLGAHVTRMHLEGVASPFPEIDSAIVRAGLAPGMTHEQAMAAFQPQTRGLEEWAYRRFVEEARRLGMHPVWIYLSTPDQRLAPAQVAELVAIAGRAGFTVINLEDVYDAHETEEVMVREWDIHPNALGHRLIADRLFGKAALLLPPAPAPSPDRLDSAPHD